MVMPGRVFLYFSWRCRDIALFSLLRSFVLVLFPFLLDLCLLFLFCFTAALFIFTQIRFFCSSPFLLFVVLWFCALSCVSRYLGGDALELALVI